MRTFGGFRSDNRFFYGELRGEKVHELAQPYWVDIRATGQVLPLANVRVGLPTAPSKLVAVGLNYADHVAEMKRTELGTPLIWFKSPSSVLPHNGVIEIAFPEHQTDFEVELAVVIGRTAKNVAAEHALDFVFGYTVALDITDRDLQKSEKQFGRCKSFDTYTPIGPFVNADVDVSDVSHEPNDLFGSGNYFVRESVAYTSAVRRDFDWNTCRGRPDPCGRYIGSSDRRLAASAEPCCRRAAQCGSRR